MGSNLILPRECVTKRSHRGSGSVLLVKEEKVEEEKAEEEYQKDYCKTKEIQRNNMFMSHIIYIVYFMHN